VAEIVYIGLGSNLAEPRAQIEAGLQALARVARTRLLRHSRLYRSAPWGKIDQPDFINAVAQLETELEPRALLEQMLAIEHAAGRIRSGDRWGPRVLDLDILLHGERVLDYPGLHVPHPRLAQRAFVLVPLAELAPDLQVPGIGPIQRLLQQVDTMACLPLELDRAAAE
jgi:2-amino-4-hydroxy-6-hydroxymethyldihydropteridine diphosphokinase